MISSTTQTLYSIVYISIQKKFFFSHFKFFFFAINVWCEIGLCVSFKRYNTLKCHESGSKLDVLVHSYRGLINPHTRNKWKKRCEQFGFYLATENFWLNECNITLLQTKEIVYVVTVFLLSVVLWIVNRLCSFHALCVCIVYKIQIWRQHSHTLQYYWSNVFLLLRLLFVFSHRSNVCWIDLIQAITI